MPANTEQMVWLLICLFNIQNGNVAPGGDLTLRKNRYFCASFMSEELIVSGNTRKEKYESLLPQISALLDGETDPVANAANIAAALRQTFGFFWVGFYFV